MSAVFGDAVVDMHGNIESAKEFMNEDRSITLNTAGKDVVEEIEKGEVGKDD
jgi:hypothetical protein